MKETNDDERRWQKKLPSLQCLPRQLKYYYYYYLYTTAAWYTAAAVVYNTWTTAEMTDHDYIVHTERATECSCFDVFTLRKIGNT